jgi:predicted transposase/invertase (TIGR01784 family)
MSKRTNSKEVESTMKSTVVTTSGAISDSATEKEETFYMSPLADPVVGAVFSNVEHAGLAAKSLVGSILEEDGYTIGEIISVTPQKHYKTYSNLRGCRVDIHLDTTDGKRVIVEVQMRTEPILERNLFSASHVILSSIKTGTDVEEFGSSIPHIIIINILNYTLRKDHPDYLQPVGMLYTKAPNSVAEDHIRIYNVQLPLFRKKQHDLSKPLDAWLYILDTAHQQHKTISEVILMEPGLKNIIDLDDGMKQFAELYERVAADAKIRDEYAQYVMDLMRLNGMYRAAKEEGREAGMEAGREAGMDRLNRLINMLIRDNRQEDLMRSTADPEFQKQLLSEYQIE